MSKAGLLCVDLEGRGLDYQLVYTNIQNVSLNLISKSRSRNILRMKGTSCSARRGNTSLNQ